MAVGYEPLHGQLVLQRRDPALLWLGKAALEAGRDSPAYLGAKENQALEQALAQSTIAYEQEDATRRATYAKRVPSEPPEGGAGNVKLCMHVGSQSHWRRFDHDCTLEDVLNYACSLPGTKTQP